MKKKHLRLSALLISALMLLTACSFPDESTTSQSNTQSSIVETTEPIETTLSSSTTSDETQSTTAKETEAESTTSSTSVISTTAQTTAPTTTTASHTEPTISEYTDNMLVHFIDVGQGDSIFIELPNGENMLIDAGESDEADKVVTYIYSQGYDTLDYVVATHPHSDHIGGMDDVVNNFNVRNFYMTSSVHTSQSYDDMLTAVNSSGAEIYEVMAGDIILNEANLLAEIVAPKAIDNDNQNNNSVVVKLTYGDKKFLFVGDAEKSEEDGIWTNIKCDVLKVGHHGSASSSSPNFLKKVEASYAVISVGLGNSYGHPDDDTLKKLNERNIQTYRTDKQGTIIFTTDGKEISVNTSPSQYEPTVVTEPPNQNDMSGTSPGNITYVLNTNTKKIHLPSCSSVKDMKDKNKGYTEDYDGAIAQGYVPCKRCNP